MKTSEFEANENLATRARMQSAVNISPAFTKRYAKPAAKPAKPGFVTRMLALSRALKLA